MMKKLKKRILGLLMVALCFGFPQTNALAATLAWPVPASRNISQGVHDKCAIDISAPQGSTVVAAMGGTVQYIWKCPQTHYNYGDCNGFGTGLVIKGDDGRTYQYAHMMADSIPANVYRTAHVSTGQQIGQVGTTGFSYGPHLHFGICYGNYWEGTGNPLNETYGSASTGTTVNSWYSTVDAPAVYDQNAQIYAKIENPNCASVSQVGVEVWKDGNRVVNHVESCSLTTSYVEQRLNINQETGVYLQHCTTYTYRLWASVGGKTIYSDTRSFTTTGAHNWTVSATKQATCTAAGSKTYSCSGCGGKRTETIPATGAHKWNLSSTKQAACQTTGSKLYTCSVCGGKRTETIPATGHSWNTSYTVDKAATYQTAGSKSIHCRTCSAIKPGSQVEIARLVKPEEPTKPVEPEPTKPAEQTPVKPVAQASVEYRTHVQSYGWQGWVSNGAMSGTSGQAKRLEGIEIRIKDQSVSGSLQYRTHIQSYGWENAWKADGAMSGTSGQGKRLEAIQIRLTGEMANQFDVYYRVHAQSFGWLGWAKNGESAGTAGHAKRLEGIEIRLVKKGGAAPGSTANAFVQKDGSGQSSGTSQSVGSGQVVGDSQLSANVSFATGISYHTHVQSYGWQSWVSNGAMSGTSGEAKRLEGIEIKLSNQPVSGSLQYRTHIQSYGWETNWKSDGAMSGTSGEAKRLEAIEIRLTGEMANRYDVYYRVHAQSFGWLGWAKNGESAGTAGCAKRLEGIEIRLVTKGTAAPGSTASAFVKR